MGGEWLTSSTLKRNVKMSDYVIRFPIGDWSDDGHGKCDWFTVKSNKPVEDVREAHFKCKLPIGELCRDYQEDKPADHLIDEALDLGVPEVFLHPEYWSPEELVDLWIRLLMITDTDLKLEVIKDETPTINFYGVDSKDRHLETPGYGLFQY